VIPEDKSSKYLRETSKVAASFKVMSPNHCLFDKARGSIQRLDKLSDPYLGEKPLLPKKEMPQRLIEHTL